MTFRGPTLIREVYNQDSSVTGSMVNIAIWSLNCICQWKGQTIIVPFDYYNGNHGNRCFLFTELDLPEKGNIYYAINTNVPEVKFVVRNKSDLERLKAKQLKNKARKNKKLTLW